MENTRGGGLPQITSNLESTNDKKSMDFSVRMNDRRSKINKTSFSRISSIMLANKTTKT